MKTRDMKSQCPQDDIRNKADLPELFTDNNPPSQLIQESGKAHAQSGRIKQMQKTAHDPVCGRRINTIDRQIAEQSLLHHEQPANHHDSAELIKLWQADTSAEHDPGKAGLIARLLQSCLDLLSSLLSDASSRYSLPRKAKNSLCRSRATLRLWADGHNALDGRLDSILERSQSLQHTTLTTLNALCEVLVNSMFLITYL
jgi:hypothetical protein